MPRIDFGTPLVFHIIVLKLCENHFGAGLNDFYYIDYQTLNNCLSAVVASTFDHHIVRCELFLST